MVSKLFLQLKMSRGYHYGSLIYGIGNATFAGATAAVTANIVLVAYIVVAMREDDSEAIEAAEKAKKAH